MRDETHCPWSDLLIHLKTVDSTNNYLKNLAQAGAPEGTAVLSDCQTAGRGRLGRQFLSQPDAGVYLSVLLRPDAPPEKLLTLTALCAEAARRALCDSCGVQPQIKWVNDLVLNGKKICGILTELSVNAASGLAQYAVIGIGINCNEASFPPPLQDIAGSVFSQSGKTVDREALVGALLWQLYTMRQTLESGEWLASYREHCLTLGKQVQVLLPSGARNAVALSIGPQAELVVAYEDGQTTCINAGEVSVRGLYGYI